MSEDLTQLAGEEWEALRTAILGDLERRLPRQKVVASLVETGWTEGEATAAVARVEEEIQQSEWRAHVATMVLRARQQRRRAVGKIAVGSVLMLVGITLMLLKYWLINSNERLPHSVYAGPNYIYVGTAIGGFISLVFGLGDLGAAREAEEFAAEAEREAGKTRNS